jgi:hypothetical protein
VAVDRTGEPNWLYGAEDIAGDGATFMQQEQSVDIRTAYASTDADRFWARVYVSDPNQAGGNVIVFVFVDSDRLTSTGGSAAAMEIDPQFDTDPSPGGYDHVLEIGGNGEIAVWDWQMTQFVRAVPPANQATAEIGQDVDPIQLNSDVHGYLQGSVVHALLDLTSACNANLFFRSVQTGGMTVSDLDVGAVGPCAPADADGDGVPDVAVPPAGCTSDDQCPGGGICVNGECMVPEPCVDAGDCGPDETCTNGVCTPLPGGPCDNDADCGDLVCRDGTCQPCTPGSDECGSGRECGADGRCVGGVTLAPGQEAQGGSFACAFGTRARPLAVLAAIAFAAAALLRRRRQPRS